MEFLEQILHFWKTKKLLYGFRLYGFFGSIEKQNEKI